MQIGYQAIRDDELSSLVCGPSRPSKAMTITQKGFYKVKVLNLKKKEMKTEWQVRFNESIFPGMKEEGADISLPGVATDD